MLTVRLFVENSADCETVVDSSDCETVVDAEEKSALRLLWMQRRIVQTVRIVDKEENSAAIRLLWMQRRTVLTVRLLWMQRRTVLLRLLMHCCCGCRGEQCLL